MHFKPATHSLQLHAQVDIKLSLRRVHIYENFFSFWQRHFLPSPIQKITSSLNQCFPTSGSRPIGGSRSYFRWVAKHF